MKTSRIAILLGTILAIGCKSTVTPETRVTGKTGFADCKPITIIVYSAKNHHLVVPIYADAKMTQPLANPFLANCEATYTFYAGDAFVVVK